MEFTTQYCKGNIRQVGFYDLLVTGIIQDNVKDNKIYYMAANQADRRATFTGSGLPFANQIQAFDNTPNMGKIQLGVTNSFEIKLITPNSYMVGLGSVTIPPTLYITYFKQCGMKHTVTIKVAEPIAYRSLTYPMDPRPRNGPLFYDNQFKMIPKTQEQLFYDSQYPCNGIQAEDFWGGKYPN